MAKEKRATWFKVFLHQIGVVEGAPDEAVGKAFKAALFYFQDGTVPELGPWAAPIFNSMKRDIDEALDDYERSVENGKKGSQIKKELKTAKPPLPSVREEEAEADAEERKEAETVVRQKPPRPRFIPPNEEQVRDYCRQMGYTFDPMHFMDYYISNGWRVGKNPMKDWRAALRTWNTKERQNGKNRNPRNSQVQAWTVGTTV